MTIRNRMVVVAQGIADLLTPVLSVIGAPVRALHNTIGHSTVTAATLLAIAILAMPLTLYSFYGDMWLEKGAAQARYLSEKARGYELDNEKKAADQARAPAMRTFRYFVPDIHADGIHLEWLADPSAARLVLEWTGQGGRGGLLTFDHLLENGTPAPIQDAIAPAASFGTAWSSGRRLTIAAAQVDANGSVAAHRSRYTLTVP